MILTDGRDIERYRSAGVWGHLALDELFLFAARKGHDRIALVDAANRSEFTGGAPKSLTWKEAAAAVESLAARFLSLRLAADDVVAVQMPNIVEAYLVTLALFRARLIACPVPPMWREYDLNAALAQVAPRALVTVGRLDGFSHADMMCYVAGEQLTVRHVLAFGDNLPDGVISLDEALNGMPLAEDELPGHRTDAANHVATLTFEPMGDGAPRPVARSHNQWIGASLLHTAAAGLSRADTILSAYFPASLMPLSAIFVPWLLTGAKLALHQPFYRDGFHAALVDNKASYTVLPSAVMAALDAKGFDWNRTALTRVGCAWPAAHRARAAGRAAPKAGGLPVVDLYSFGEIATYAASREAGHVPGRVPLGAIRLDAQDVTSPVVLETRVQGGVQKAGAATAALGGALQVRGAMVPARNVGPANGRLAATDDAPPDAGDDGGVYVDTGLQVLVGTTSPPTIDCLAGTPDMFHVGGAAVSALELDRLVAGHSGVSDAAVYQVADPLLGDRIEAAVVPRDGTIVSSEDMRAYLTSRKVAEHKIPMRTIRIPRIPRDDKGRVDRLKLAQQGN